MKKTLLIVAMLLLVTPVMAIDITTIKVLVNPAEQYNTGPDSNKVQPVSIAYTSDVNVRAFALDINIDSGPAFHNIRNFKTGESNATSPGYGIFPSRFREVIVVTGPNWADPNYNPTTYWNEPETTDHNSGMGWPKMIVEMGTLYAGEANAPPKSGTLFKFDVNSGGAVGTFHITVKANALRGGVVNQDGNSINSPNLVLEGNDVCFAPPVCTLPDVVSQPEATATEAITNAGFQLGTRTETCSSVGGIVAGDIISTDPVAGSYVCDSFVNYVVSTGPCCTVIPAIRDKTMTDANTALTNAGFTQPPAITYECNDACAVGKVCRQDTGCVAASATINYVVSLGSVPAAPASITVPASDADGAYTVSWTAVTGATSYQLESSAPASGTTVYPLWVQIYSGATASYSEKVGGGTWSYRVKASNACSSSGYTTGGTNCVVTNSLKATATGYADWVKYRYPQCWAFRRHCRGDIEGKKKLSGGYVSSDDLTIFRGVYGLTVAQIVAAPCTTVTTTGRICGFCADLDHKNKLVGGRVSADDLGIFKTYYLAADAAIKCCDTAAPAEDCTLVAGDSFSYWTN